MRRYALVVVDLEEKPGAVDDFFAWLRLGCKVLSDNSFTVYSARDAGNLQGVLDSEKKGKLGNLRFKTP